MNVVSGYRREEISSLVLKKGSRREYEEDKIVHDFKCFINMDKTSEVKF